MAKTMTASQTITDGQIEAAVEQFRAALRKKRGNYLSEPFQKVLGLENLGQRLIEPLGALVEAQANVIVREVPINRDRSPEDAIAATGRREYLNPDVVKAMPRGEGQGPVEFFQVGKTISCAQLAKEYESRGLVPDPYAVAAVLEADPAFADDRYVAAQWKDKDGNWCYAVFDRWGDGRKVHVNRYDYGWYDKWWFGGVRKQS